MRLIIGMSGASGSRMCLRLMRELKARSDIETHLIVTEGARITWKYEMQQDIQEVYDCADHVYDERDLAAVIASGSFLTDGMIVVPCSMKTLAGIVSGYADNLLLRAADVCLKEDRKVVLVPREMPMGKVHLRNMKDAADLGCRIVPPMLTFYNGAETLDSQIDHVIGKVLMQFGMVPDTFVPWAGPSEEQSDV